MLRGALVLAACLAVAGCGSDLDDTEVHEAPPMSLEERIDRSFQATLGDVHVVADLETARHIGMSYCDIIVTHPDDLDYFDEVGVPALGRQLGVEPLVSAFISGAAVGAYCPEYVDFVLGEEPGSAPV